MGKLAKQRRFQRWKDAKKIAVLTTESDHLKSVAAFDRRTIADTKRENISLSEKLNRIEAKLREFCANSALLEIVGDVPPHATRTAIRERMNSHAFIYDDSWKFRSMPIEELMLVLQSDQEMQDRFARCMHFRVKNPPGAQGFTCGYAVTHTELKLLRMRREDFVQMIAENIAAHIYESLYGKRKPAEAKA